MQELIDHAINQADDCKVGVVYLDLDNFKKGKRRLRAFIWRPVVT